MFKVVELKNSYLPRRQGPIYFRPGNVTVAGGEAPNPSYSWHSRDSLAGVA